MTNYNKLIAVLEEIFQLNQADLDFGIYRILNQKREEITTFLQHRLIPQVKDIIQQSNLGDTGKWQKELEEAIAQATALGANPDTLPKVQELRVKYQAAPSPESLENEIFSHLTAFFKRYYKDGDFISMRRYKKDVYAIPYEGEEVKLHWANHDQYYIKTSEHLKNYAFKVPEGRLVRFELSEASTEKDNRKEESGKERRFKLFAEKPLEVNGNTLSIFFTYEPTDKKEKQDSLNNEAAELIKKNLPADWVGEVLKKAPTEKDKNRTLLEKHLKDFTARNTFDYFIHKDLGGFLTRELDFYIKNEVLHLDDVNSDSPMDFQKQLVKIQALRDVGGKIITFLAQLENFQKKLWLKKKFVVDTQYCITLDRIPESFYPEIAANEAQRDEWVRLFAIDELVADPNGEQTTLFGTDFVAYAEPLSVEFLKSQPYLVLDTAFFSQDFKLRLLATFDNLDEQLDGLLINSENFQALSLLQERYREQVKCVYIDPPYNTGGDGFVYKDNFQHSSWISMIYDRLQLSKTLLSKTSSFFSSIDDTENHIYKLALDSVFQAENFLSEILWQKRYAPDARVAISDAHEYILAYTSNYEQFKVERNKLPLTDKQTSQFSNPDNDPRGPWKSDNFTAQGYRPNQMYEIQGPNGSVYTPPTGRCWVVVEEEFRRLKEDARMYFGQNGDGRPAVKRFLKDMDGMVPWTWWGHKEVGHSQAGKKELMAQMGREASFETVKPTALIERVLMIATQKDSLILDFFAGSGTTAISTIQLNSKEKESKRKYLLCEMGDYFSTILLPRIQRMIYSEDWKDGKPVSRKGNSHAFKYLRLESYEDTLNNLVLQRKDGQQQLLGLNERFEEEYMLSYLLDVESEGSLLNTAVFENPFAYQLNIIKDNEAVPTALDLVETFNYLIGLKVKTTQRIRGFYVVTGENLQGEQLLVIWRNLQEKSNEDLNAFFQKQQYNTRDQEFDRIYVNGDNNLENLKIGDEQWKVGLIEEVFLGRMFDSNEMQ